MTRIDSAGLDAPAAESAAVSDAVEAAPEAAPAQSKSSHIIASVLTPAVRFWLRSQLEHVEDLEVAIEASDRQVFSGTIHRVAVSAQKAVYQGLHLSQVQVAGEQIYTNLRQVLRGKPLRLLQSFPVSGRVLLHEADLNASLQAPLLGNAVIDFLLTLLKSDGSADGDLEGQDAQAFNLQEPQVVLSAGHITFTAALVSASGNKTPVIIRTGLRVENGRELKLDRPQWLPHANARQGLPLRDLDGMTFDLGSQVALEELTLAAGQVVCRGQITVTPEET